MSQKRDLKLGSAVVTLGMILFNYSILRAIKDTVITKILNSMYIPCVKLIVVTPLIMLITIPIYNYFLNKYGPQYTIFFTVLPVTLYINIYSYFSDSSSWLPYSVVSYLTNVYDTTNYKILLIGSLMLINIHHILCYVFAEMWGTMVLSSSFWTIVNYYSSIEDAKSYYGVLPSYANIGTALGGFLTYQISTWYYHDYEIAFKILIYTFNAVSISLLLFYRFVFWKVFNIDQHTLNEEKEAKTFVKTSKPSMIQSIRSNFALFFNNITTSNLFVCIVSYGLIINLMEVIWKNAIAKQSLTVAAFLKTQGLNSLITSIVSILISYFTSYLLHKKWIYVALVTPISLGLTGLGFISMYLFGGYIWSPDLVLQFAVNLGLMNNVISKVSKYTFFDPSKECVFVSLDPSIRSKAKVVDSVGGRLGKSAGSLIYFVTMMSLVSINDLRHASAAKSPIESIAVYVLIFIIFSMIAWIRSILTLNKVMTEKFDLSDEASNTKSNEQPVTKSSKSASSAKPINKI